jgi:hypothetical protein
LIKSLTILWKKIEKITQAELPNQCILKRFLIKKDKKRKMVHALQLLEEAATDLLKRTSPKNKRKKKRKFNDN